MEEHFVLLDGLPDAHVLAVESGHSSLLASLELSLGLGSVIGVVAVKVTVVVFVLAGVDGLLDLVALFLLLLGELQVQPLLFLLLFDLCHERTPREFDRHGALVHYLVVLVGEECDGGRLGVDVALGEVDVVVVGLAEHWYLGLQPVVLQRQFL